MLDNHEMLACSKLIKCPLASPYFLILWLYPAIIITEQCPNLEFSFIVIFYFILYKIIKHKTVQKTVYIKKAFFIYAIEFIVKFHKIELNNPYVF